MNQSGGSAKIINVLNKLLRGPYKSLRTINRLFVFILFVAWPPVAMSDSELAERDANLFDGRAVLRGVTVETVVLWQR